MARVSVEQRVFSDQRFDLLGKFLEADRWAAIGRMLVVWNECQERNSYTLPERIVSAAMGDRDGAKWVVEADLADWERDGVLRIKGTEGRVEWLAQKRESARLGGRARVASAKRDKNGTFQPSHHPPASHSAGMTPATSQPSNQASPSAPAPAPALEHTPNDTSVVNPTAVEFLVEKASAKGNTFTPSQRLELEAGLDRIAAEFGADATDRGIAEVFKRTDPPRTPAIILREVLMEAESARRMRGPGGSAA